MTPGMSARDITFARRRTSIEGVLSREWWGERDRMTSATRSRNEYAFCYPGVPKPRRRADKGIAQEMILRRREKQTLDALEDLAIVPAGRARGTEGGASRSPTAGCSTRPNSNLARPLSTTTATRRWPPASESSIRATAG